MKRGDVFTAAAGSGFGGKPRPVIIVHSDLFIARATVIMVAPVVDEEHHVPLLRPFIQPTPSNGLTKRSVIATDTLVAVRLRQFGQLIGVLSAGEMGQVEAALLLTLGFVR